MSKAAIALIAIKNVLVFNNTNEKVQFFAKKGERVTATMSGFETGKYDVKLLAAASKEALNYYRVQANADGEFVNGALFPTKKKNTANSPSSSGVVNCIDGSFSPNKSLMASSFEMPKAAALASTCF